MDNVAHNINNEERTSDIRLAEKSPFSKMMLPEQIRRGLEMSGFTHPTVLQHRAIPLGIAGIDLLIQSKSGTGKTLIFCTIILATYESHVKAPQSLILVPTREIAIQIESILNNIGRCLTDFRAISVIGGTDIQLDRKKLQCAKTIIGTPGRVIHLIRSSILNSEFLKLLVIDEADKFLNSSFKKNLEEILASFSGKMQTIACSATLDMGLDDKLAKYMKNPLLLSTEKRAVALIGIKQFALELPEEKTNILEMTSKCLSLKKLFSQVSFKQCIVFVNSQSRAQSYCCFLEKEKWPCDFISAAQDQSVRLEKFRRFREFKTRILIATDLMSRGIDSEYLNLVVNLEVPNDAALYLHRVGRAGRFGTHGLAVTFLCSSKDKDNFNRILNTIGSDMIVYNYPLNSKCDLWDSKNFETNALDFGLYKNSAEDLVEKDNQILISHSQPNLERNKIKELSNENDKGNFTFTISDSSHKAPSNSAITLDDASSLTVDSDVLHIKNVAKNVGVKEVQNSKTSNIERKVFTNSQRFKLCPINLVLDSDSKTSIIRTNLFEDYNAVANSNDVEIINGNFPNSSEYSEVTDDPDRSDNYCVFKLTDSNENETSVNIFNDYKNTCKNSSNLENSKKSEQEQFPVPCTSSGIENSVSNVLFGSDEIKKKVAILLKSDKSIKRNGTSNESVEDSSSDSVSSDYNDNSESEYSGSVSAPSSGFEEKVPTEASSGIVTSTEFSYLETESAFTYSSTSESSSIQSEKESSSFDERYDQEKRRNFGLHYQQAYNLWTNAYWEQINHIRQYLNISKHMRRRANERYNF